MHIGVVYVCDQLGFDNKNRLDSPTLPREFMGRHQYGYISQAHWATVSSSNIVYYLKTNSTHEF